MITIWAFIEKSIEQIKNMTVVSIIFNFIFLVLL